MRALRDFNTPKIYMEDVPIFMGLIGDLFPALNVPRKRDPDFEACVKKSMLVRTCACIVTLKLEWNTSDRQKYFVIYCL